MKSFEDYLIENVLPVNQDHEKLKSEVQNHLGAYDGWHAKNEHNSQYNIKDPDRAHEHLTKQGWDHKVVKINSHLSTKPHVQHHYTKGTQTVVVGLGHNKPHYLMVKTR